MSYQISVYFTDENIKTTTIYYENASFTVTKNYGDDAYIASGFSGKTKFTATPADGCEFTKWYYRIGGDSGVLQESTSNPFYYNGTEDIIIRAEGKTSSGGGDSGGGTGVTIEEWSWSSPNNSIYATASATQEETRMAVWALNLGWSTTEFSHKVWNDMVEKVYEISWASGYKWWDDDYANKKNTKLTNTDEGRKLYAYQFNSLRHNLELAGGHIGLGLIDNASNPDNPTSGTIPHPVYSGDKVYGHYFTTLVDYMNDCIAAING